MVERVLFPTDGSAGAMSTLEHALDLAVDHGASLQVLTVREDGDPADRDVLGLASERASERGIPVDTVERDGRPYQEILTYAEQAEVDLLVMPTHGRTGLERLLLGSVTARVMRLADIPVLTACPDAELRYPYRRVLVPTDGSRCAESALDVGIEFAETAGVPLTALSVVETPRSDANVHASVERDRRQELAQEAVESAAATARERLSDVSTAVVRGSSVPETIQECARDNRADLIVVGTHGRTGLDRYLFGGVTEKLVRTAEVPIVTVREPERE